MYLGSKMSGSQPCLLFNESNSFTTAVVLLLLQLLFDFFPVVDVNDDLSTRQSQQERWSMEERNVILCENWLGKHPAHLSLITWTFM